jgi:hypothetical protein
MYIFMQYILSSSDEKIEGKPVFLMPTEKTPSLRIH